MNIGIKKLSGNAKIPVYGSKFAAGADLYACLDGDVKIGAGQTAVIPTGIALELPVGYAGLIYARSGLATKQGLAPANKVGVAALTAAMSDPEFFRQDSGAITAHNEAVAAAQAELDGAYARWEELEGGTTG